MRACVFALLVALVASICGCKAMNGDSADDQEENQKIGANAD
jgi:hypothetical protein